MHPPFRCGGPSLFRAGLSPSSALSGAVPAFHLRQHLRLGNHQAARWRSRLVGTLLHPVFPFCMGGSANHQRPALCSATPYAPTGLLGTALWTEFHPRLSPLALPARRERALRWSLGSLALPPRWVGLRPFALDSNAGYASSLLAKDITGWMPTDSRGLDTSHPAHHRRSPTLLDSRPRLYLVLPPAGSPP